MLLKQCTTWLAKFFVNLFVSLLALQLVLSRCFNDHSHWDQVTRWRQTCLPWGCFSAAAGTETAPPPAVMLVSVLTYKKVVAFLSDTWQCHKGMHKQQQQTSMGLQVVPRAKGDARLSPLQHHTSSLFSCKMFSVNVIFSNCKIGRFFISSISLYPLYCFLCFAKIL